MEEIKRKRILAFLQWNDCNGCYTDKNCKIEGVPVIKYKEAIRYFFGMMNDDEYYRITDNIFELEYEVVINIAKERLFFERANNKLEVLEKQTNPTVEFYKNLI